MDAQRDGVDVLDGLDPQMKTLPLILCGPMLRRVDEHSCFVWVATSNSCRIELEIRDHATDRVVGRSDGDENEEPEQEGTAAE